MKQKTTCPACGHTHEVKPEKIFYSDDAKSVLACLNRMAGKKYKNSKHSLEHIQARLNDGYSKDECIKVLDIKVKDRWFVDNNNFNPQTIFRPGNFERYVNETPAPSSDDILKTANIQAQSIVATIRKHGPNVTPGYNDPITKKVVEKKFKGWQELCKSEAKFLQRNFVQAYVQIAKGENI